MPQSYADNGNALIEYLIPVGVLAVIVFAGVSLFGGDFPSYLSAVSNAKTSSPQNARLELKAMGSNPYLQSVPITLSDGTVLMLENYPTDLAKAIETLGADGTTDLLAANLEALVRQLREQGKISDADANQLLALANQGHRLAKIQSLIGDKVSASGDDVNLFLNTPIEFDGKIYKNGFELSRIMAMQSAVDNVDFDPTLEAYYKERFTPFDTKTLSPGYFEKYGYGGAPELNHFVKLFAQADQMTAVMKNPEINALVGKLSDQIVAIADSASDKIVLTQDP